MTPLPTFPPLTQKEFDRLPKVFQEIIEWDEKDPRRCRIVKLSDHDDYLKDVADWKFNRNNLSEGARKALQKQRGGSTA